MTKKLYQKTNSRQIRSRLILMGIKQSDIARDLDVSTTAINRVIMGTSISSRIRAELARRLGTTPEAIWRLNAR